KEVGAAYVKESGCRRFSIAISQKDPNHVLLLEAWDNAAAHDAQLTTDRLALEIYERAMGESLAVRGAQRPRSSHSHHSEWCEGAGVAWQHASEPRAVTENNARHPVVVYPVEAERGVHLWSVVHREEAIALQSPRGHQDEHAKRGIAETEAD